MNNLPRIIYIEGDNYVRTQISLEPVFSIKLPKKLAYELDRDRMKHNVIETIVDIWNTEEIIRLDAYTLDMDDFSDEESKIVIDSLIKFLK